MAKLPGICPIPWVATGINNNGDYRMCVHSVSKLPERGVCRNDDGTVMRVETANMDDVRNSDIYRKTRQQMLNGEFSDNCIRCKSEELSGMGARRLLELERYESVFSVEDAVKYTNKDGTIDNSQFPLRDIDLRLDNICNLACRYCGPSESNRWYKEWPDVTGKEFFKSYDHIIPIKNGMYSEGSPYGWSERIDIMGFFDKLEDLKTLYLSGGEPLINKQHLDVLRMYIDKGLAKNMDLSYNTNLTLLPKGIFDLWKEFKCVYLGCSIEGVGKINDYIRYPSTWEDINKIIHLIDSNCTPNVRPWFSITWNIYNTLEILKLIEWSIEQRFTHMNKWASVHRVLTYHPLHNPDFLCVTTLPTHAKEKVKAIFENWMNSKFKAWHETDTKSNQMTYDAVCKMLNAMIAFMYTKDSSGSFDRFTAFTERLDNMRGQSFKEVCPDLYQILYE